MRNRPFVAVFMGMLIFQIMNPSSLHVSHFYCKCLVQCGSHFSGLLSRYSQVFIVLGYGLGGPEYNTDNYCGIIRVKYRSLKTTTGLSERKHY